MADGHRLDPHLRHGGHPADCPRKLRLADARWVHAPCGTDVGDSAGGYLKGGTFRYSLPQNGIPHSPDRSGWLDKLRCATKVLIKNRHGLN